MYNVTINWGDEGENPQTYSFKTLAEIEAFRLGIYEAQGWDDYSVADETYDEYGVNTKNSFNTEAQR